MSYGTAQSTCATRQCHTPSTRQKAGPPTQARTWQSSHLEPEECPSRQPQRRQLLQRLCTGAVYCPQTSAPVTPDAQGVFFRC